MRKTLAIWACSLLMALPASESLASDWVQFLEQADSISEAGYHDSAAVLGYQALELVEREFDPQDTVIAYVLERTGTYLNRFADHADAELLFRRSLEIRENASGPEHSGTASSLYGLAGSCMGLGKYRLADLYYQRCLRIREELYGEMHENVADAIAGLGSLYGTQMIVPMAEAHLQRAIDIYEKTLGPEHKKVGKTIAALGTVRTGQVKLADADSLHRRALSILTKQLGDGHPDMCMPYCAVAVSSAFQGRYDQANSLCEKALEISQRSRGAEHVSFAKSLFAIALVRLLQGKYVDAESLGIRALELTEAALGPRHPQTGRTIGLLAQVYRNLGRYAEADSLARLSMTIREQSSAEDSFDMAESLSTLAAICSVKGRFAEADSLYTEAIACMETQLETSHVDLASVLSGFAASLFNQGRYLEAEPLLERALAICDASEASDGLQVSAVLNNIAVIQLSQGRFRDGEETLRRSLALVEKVLGKDNRHSAQYLQNLSALKMLQRNYDEAEILAKRALRIVEHMVGPDNDEVAGILSILGAIESHRENYGEAESLFVRSRDIRVKVLGPDNPRVAISIDNIAELYAHQGRYDEALELHDEAYAIRKQALGSEHPAIAEGQETYATLLSLRDDWTEALSKGREAFHIRRRHFEGNGHSLAESDVLSFARQVRASANRHLSLYFGSNTDDASERIKTADVILASKGQVSDMIFDRRKPIVNETDPDILALADSLRIVQFQLSALFVNGPGTDTTGRYRIQLDSLQSLADEVESDLAGISASYRKHQEQKDITLDRVVSRLPDSAILIEYFKYDHFTALTDSVEPRYGALVLSYDSTPEIISLGRASNIERLIIAYRHHMLDISNLSSGPTVFDLEDYRSVCQPLFEIIWQPVMKFVDGKELIFVAPDGGLHMISFAGLPCKDDTYLVERHTIHYLSSGRDLIKFAAKPKSASGLFALGDPDYDVMSLDEESRTSDGDNRTRNIRSGCGELQDLHVPALPGTRKEVEQLISSWKASTDEPVTSYYGQDASEDRLKFEAPGHRVIHLATHGFFLEKSCNPDIPFTGISSSQGFAGENPLLLSGLLFAGANQAGSDSARIHNEDGILTAYEVSSMSLTGTELVVLSACETGLGEVESGEGVYGLRRAFQTAGALSVISALWPIADEPTAEMMGRLYSGGGESLTDRMRSIQLEKIEELRESGEPDHPFSWGGFVALGDWRW